MLISFEDTAHGPCVGACLADISAAHFGVQLDESRMSHRRAAIDDRTKVQFFSAVSSATLQASARIRPNRGAARGNLHFL